MLERFTSFVSLRPVRAKPPMEIRLLGPRVMLRLGEVNDWMMWRDVRERSRDYLVPWEPLWPPNALEYRFFCNMLRRQWRDWRRGTSYAFLIFLHDDDEGSSSLPLIGGINLNEVESGPNGKATLGYWISKERAGLGYMTEAATLVCNFAFARLGLRQLEASCLPHNEASKKVLNRIGFFESGFARNYLRINGRFEDHLLWRKMRPTTKETKTSDEFLHSSGIRVR